MLAKRTYRQSQTWAKMSSSEADEASDQVLANLLTMRHDVLAQLREPNSSVGAKSALYRLAAELNVYQAIELLIRDIQFDDERDTGLPGTSDTRMGGHIAQMALSAFGLPAVYAILDIIGNNEPDTSFVAAKLRENIALLCGLMNG